ncbi:hypothetical protein [Jannaschia rubra]|uniref:hypothetical protein n=1 Tax=Jannaschia rubra TaxID=282197 RepID=UPI000944FF98|nr:hypothetical protein [Jannaschia rubra]
MYKFKQRRSADPDFSEEERRQELAFEMLECVPELRAMGRIEAAVEACHRVGFNGFDDACLVALAKVAGVFPLDIRTEAADKFKVHLGSAMDALTSAPDNADFWDNPDLVEEAKRREPKLWRDIEMKMRDAARKRGWD